MTQACSASVRTRRDARSGRVIGALYEAAGAGSTRPPSPRRLGHRRSPDQRSEEHTSELQSLMRISYAVFCLKKKKQKKQKKKKQTQTIKNTLKNIDQTSKSK